MLARAGQIQLILSAELAAPHMVNGPSFTLWQCVDGFVTKFYPRGPFVPHAAKQESMGARVDVR